MKEISGPNSMLLLQKGEKRYLLIGDRHRHYLDNVCESSEEKRIFLPEFLDELFQKENWDFYLEQGVYGVENPDVTDEKGVPLQFLSLLDKDTHLNYDEMLKNPSKYNETLLDLTYTYFKERGCFKKNHDECKYERSRFHFIDIRQNYFGKKCRMTLLDKYANFGVGGLLLYEGLIKLVQEYHVNLKMSNDDLEKEIKKFIDIYIKNVHAVLDCLDEQKLKKQVKNSTMTKEITDYFEEPQRLITSILDVAVNTISENKDFLLTVIMDLVKASDRENVPFSTFIPKLIESIGNKFYGEDWQKMLDSIEQSEYLQNTTSDHLGISPSALGFELQNLIMDKYALSRMTKPYNRNVAVLAGINHIKSYEEFLTSNGYNIVWEGKKINDKCIGIPLMGGMRKTRRKERKKRKTKKKKSI